MTLYHMSSSDNTKVDSLQLSLASVVHQLDIQSSFQIAALQCSRQYNGEMHLPLLQISNWLTYSQDSQCLSFVPPVLCTRFCQSVEAYPSSPRSDPSFRRATQLHLHIQHGTFFFCLVGRLGLKKKQTLQPCILDVRNGKGAYLFKGIPALGQDTELATLWKLHTTKRKLWWVEFEV